MSENGDTPHVVEGSEDIVEEEDFYSESDEVILSPQEPITRRHPRINPELGEVQQDDRRGARSGNEYARRPYAHGHCHERKSRARVRTDGNEQKDRVD